MIGICINIHGFKMFIYPYENMLDTTMLNNITEWQMTSLSNIFNYSFYIFLIMVIINMFMNNKKVKFIDLLLFCFTAFLGIKSIRFWLYCPIVMSFSIFDYFENRKLDRGTNTILTIIIIGLFGAFILNVGNMYNMKYNIFLSDKDIKVIKKENPQRLFNMYNYGGELVYNDIKVFIDGRADLYSKYNYKDYLDICNCEKECNKLIDKYNFDYLLIDKDYPIYKYLKDNSDYSNIYHNKSVILYKKNS